MKKTSKIVILLIAAIIFLSGIWYVIYVNRPLPEESVKIGALLPLSGQNAVYGIEIQNAIELARGEINSKGGINGKNLEIIYEDDQADPKLGTNAMQKLVNTDKVPLVLGSWASGVVAASAPIAEQNKVIVMASAISPAITNAGNYIFRIQPSATFYTAKSAEILRKLNVSTAAVLYINNEFGTSLKDSFVSDFEAREGKVIVAEAYAQGDIDFRSQLIKIKSKNPQIIFIAGYQDTINAIKQIAELDIDARILAGPPFESQRTIEALGELAEGVIYPYHFVPGKDKSKHYEEAYLEKYGVQTGGFAPLMYDATYIIAQTLTKCGEDTDCIKQELYNTEYEGVVGKITFDKNGDPAIPIVIKTVKNGEFVLYEE